jgi:hypothetical protein
MKTRNIIEGLKTLEPYYANPGGYNCGANHDVIYGYPTDKPLTDDDVKTMIDLGWHQEYDERDYNEDFSVKDYRSDESWHAYT